MNLTRAFQLLERGQAVMAGDKIQIVGPGLEFRLRLAAAECEREFARNRGDRVYWNGDGSKGETCPPGAARS